MDVAPPTDEQPPAGAGPPELGPRAADLPHAPEAGWTKRLLGRYHVTGAFWFRFHCWGISVLPKWGVNVIVAVFTCLFFPCLIKARRAISRNLEAVLGPCGFLRRQLRIFRSMWTFGWCLSERYERLATNRSFRIDIDLPRWQSLFEPGHGFVMVTAHLGNFEVGSMLPAFEEDRQVHVVREKEADPEAQQFIQELLVRAGGTRYVTHFEGEHALQGVELVHVLRDGGIVGVQGDRPRSGGRTVPVTLFGRPFPLPAGPAALARAAEVPLVPIFVFRVARLHYRVEIRDPIPVGRSSSRGHDVAEAMGRVAATIEWAIRQQPHQWFCFHDVWPRSVQGTGPSARP